MTSIKVVVASKNPVKINCTSQAFSKAFPNAILDVQGVSVPSNVSDQPMTDAETLEGAKNRARNARSAQPEADYWVGIEGGIDQESGTMEAFAWISIIGRTKEGKARTASFDLPEKIRALVNQGVELGHADDMVFERTNSKQGNGAVGILTNGLIDRAAYYEPAVVLALIPFLNQELY
ncbi:inosine/xanthosine triphosphatase [Roseivirga pacifica]|jgi:inosine/xanthosine triphosphatase|uniref:inosine/xanthosine triphosphatase n=1 Tax=Roseivirga pacifica TaxID=1267423 RepID=UPI003BAB937E